MEKALCLPFLREEDKKRAMRFVQEKDKVLHLFSAYLKRKYVGDYSLNPYGKPIAEGKHFNLSHCRKAVIFASSNAPIGVDIENIRESKEELRRYVCNEEELKLAKDDLGFFKVWTSKESVAKAEGEGIDVPIKTIPALPLIGEKEYKGQAYFSALLPFDEFVISVSRLGKRPFEIVLEEEVISS